MGRLYFKSEDYKTLIPKINHYLNIQRHQKAFVFIDPYGYKDISVKDIEKLLGSENSEVLLFLPTQFMFRFEKKGTPESLKKFIKELIHEEYWPTNNTGINFIESLRDSFRNYFNYKFLVDSFIISRDKNQFFSLFFFTKHIYGFEKMLEAKWQIDEEEGRGWSFEEDNNLFSELKKAPNTIKYEKELNSFLKKERSNAEIYKFTIEKGYLPRHTTQILRGLQKNNLIKIKSLNSIKIRKNAFYINYSNYRDNPKKITIKI